ncbi:alkaline phosphatase D family protein [Catelliglobosispora koreensis]|uniref:alkaline phosphatase D family protein n=1 Tax=Catelliglobosispora koreensis TaxID=129052 RepID=UPI0004773908|nr:alkaline phosphatase D family protein [Catelliglobosispora koreensis]
MKKVNRRTFVLGGVATAGAFALTMPNGSKANGLATIAYPFKLGVASGEPDSSSVVLWTRLAPTPLHSSGFGGMPTADVTVDWQVSTNDRFTTLTASGSVVARSADAHSVHIVAGGLNPDSDYYYRFRAQGHISAVGRTRTAPAPGTNGRDLVMAFASCQHYEMGYYNAHRRMVEDDPGLILFLGDYIYEGAATAGRPRIHVGGELQTLADHRRRYAQYKSDPDLQAAHAIAPWLVVPDDHEVENNYAGMVRNTGESPVLSQQEWIERRTAAYRAFYENMPLRPAQKYNGNSIPLYRRVHWGQLATFHMLDTRQFRTDQACGDGRQPPSCGEGTSRTLPGIAQEDWLLDGLAQHSATWDLIGQQVFFARHLDTNGEVSMDKWDGYTASRARIQNGWVQRQTRNPVVLTGDVHQHWANDLKADYGSANSRVIGAELITTSVSSVGDEALSTEIPNGAANPHIKFFGRTRGYVRTTISPSQIQADFRRVSQVGEHGATATTLKSFVILDGQPGLQAI